MPTTVQALFESNEITKTFVTNWNSNIRTEASGVYIVSVSEDPNWLPREPLTITLNEKTLGQWIKTVTGFSIDNNPATIPALTSRLEEFWLPDESILYIGKAPKRAKGTGLRTRVGEYYRTQIGASSPHSGGQWIQTLNDLDDYYVHY